MENSKGKIWLRVPSNVTNDVMFRYFNCIGNILSFKICSIDDKSKVVKLVYESEEDCEKLSHCAHNVCLFDDEFKVTVLKREGKVYGTMGTDGFGLKKVGKNTQSTRSKYEDIHLDYPLGWM
ncbi:hypothetical protein EHI8A_100600 [Entamoeba histolytica HM-1:IMSS-B]|uniref:RRM domain-containing protein n=6 Tax=Entamoeba histolytica TaxID=5759 RepID=C4M091_ENTH1|nr:hypothetical protein EHI_004970 [Entamoeba histolytica HM-1:IMSS]EMD43297.1 Hypothetical protein EHI5A_138170 [Entamoeba histolytica KU27]EMH72030.1 hypothetical protein EHI8A_100600 [Entamoeba histolytica HM-1:IMSS-B]EMS16385.1 hypothetical protein KM1_172960 [Entamoeba histolytica HM-3:IMSS]ENY61903.1 hypothetical protein EHI7A_096380 [Entamoeba histolytica HM-1:IMSS-A]GAT94567.1 hypothetical protein CL6EHI_004970 [Entamoeba histolytica]|eukprot:XP_652510.1 hypothetical protein EHI_004970 [Entamoeba histolytica HM-1:IMSS]